MKYILSVCILSASLLFQSCGNHESAGPAKAADSTGKTTAKAESAQPPAGQSVADAATILGRKEVPILCYHHIRPLKMPGKASSGYEVTPESFRAQMKMLSDSGYHTVLPDQLYNYLAFGTALPEKPVMITYDDTDEEQFSIGKTEMDKYGFKGVYFLMTISINRPRYMSKEQIKQLSNEGHAVECHTWDHHRVDKYIAGDRQIAVNGKPKTVNDWNDQLVKPSKTIEAITGKPTRFFAYPFGIWSPSAFPELKSRDYKLAFQLSTKRDSTMPLYTVRRIIIDPSWSAGGLLRVMRSSFH
jgi:peptidoglycan/xylan/chitin deacetylase (PgdA/CDA1 family)